MQTISLDDPLWTHADVLVENALERAFLDIEDSQQVVDSFNLAVGNNSVNDLPKGHNVLVRLWPRKQQPYRNQRPWFSYCSAWRALCVDAVRSQSKGDI